MTGFAETTTSRHGATVAYGPAPHSATTGQLSVPAVVTARTRPPRLRSSPWCAPFRRRGWQRAMPGFCARLSEIPPAGLLKAAAPCPTRSAPCQDRARHDDGQRPVRLGVVRPVILPVVRLDRMIDISVGVGEVDSAALNDYDVRSAVEVHGHSRVGGQRTQRRWRADAQEQTLVLPDSPHGARMWMASCSRNNPVGARTFELLVDPAPIRRRLVADLPVQAEPHFGVHGCSVFPAYGDLFERRPLPDSICSAPATRRAARWAARSADPWAAADDSGSTHCRVGGGGAA